MADQVLPPPKARWYVSAFNTVLRFAINGLGANAAYTALVAEVPWMAGPIAKWIIDTFIGEAEKEIEIGADKVLIRFGGDIRQANYEKAIQPIREKDHVTPEELAAAKAAIDKFGYQRS